MLDTIIIGAGPAGMTAGIYAARAELSHLILEGGLMSGGQIINTSEVDNYPGLKGIGGFDLAMKFREHCDQCGVRFQDGRVTEVKRQDGGFLVCLENGESLLAKTVLFATGATHRKLYIPGESEYAGSGVSYCATCDGAFFKGKETAVIGGGDVAVEDALFLSRICKKVYLVHRREEFRAAKALVNRLRACENVEFVLSSVPVRITGTGQVEGLVVKGNEGEKELPVSGVFIAVGMVPNTGLLKELVSLDEAGYVIAGEDCKTDAEGIFAAGDLRTKSLRQVITAAADGAAAIREIEAYLNSR
ncbi:MAG: thioredoxin-disulfide reductase [Lachnospiraceae bacterium]|nr:thioredoxin-disulfide reductase [Lachnospiraceae bacterium]